jgi:hypothetical protein
VGTLAANNRLHKSRDKTKKELDCQDLIAPGKRRSSIKGVCKQDIGLEKRQNLYGSRNGV